MIKLRLVVVVVMAGALMVLTAPVTHAAADPYPVRTPTPTQSVAPADDATGPDDEATDDNLAADDNGILPDTGGVAFYLLLAGGVLVIAGAGAIYGSRRRHTNAR